MKVRCSDCAVADQLQCVLDEGHTGEHQYAEWPSKVNSHEPHTIFAVEAISSDTPIQRFICTCHGKIFHVLHRIEDIARITVQNSKIPTGPAQCLRIVQICDVPDSGYTKGALYGVGADGIVYYYDSDPQHWVPLSSKRKEQTVPRWPSQTVPSAQNKPELEDRIESAMLELPEDYEIQIYIAPGISTIVLRYQNDLSVPDGSTSVVPARVFRIPDLIQEFLDLAKCHAASKEKTP